MKTAVFLRDIEACATSMSTGWKLWRLSEPLCGSEYVVSSAANVVFSGPETYIFPADSDGNVTDWGELPGSFRGGLDHKEAIRGAGYTIVEDLCEALKQSLKGSK